jgi:selenium metabolism protein YedF
MITVDARGEACPIPVVRTKNAVKALGGPGKVKTLVDNEIAVQNLTKMADRKGWKASSKKTGEDTYEVLLSVGTAPQEQDEAETACIPDTRKKKTVIQVSSDTVGSGNDELGHVLMKSFVYALTQQDVLPETMIFYNTGAKLTCEGSPVLEDLQTLAAMGVEIVTCGTCLDFQHLKEKLQIGTVTNMYDIAERLLKADHIIRP